MTIPRKRRYPMKPLPRRWVININTGPSAKALAAAIVKWKKDKQ